MADPWLSIIGIGEDGLSGLSDASRNALAGAEVVFGAPRHLALAGVAGREWPIPFDAAPVMALRGRRVAILASGDPFWHGAGGTLTAQLDRGEWQAFPVAGTFSLAAARMGWRLEEVLCLGLHAAPLDSLRARLQNGTRAILLLRDAAAVDALVAWLNANGWAGSTVTVLERLGGPQERIAPPPALAAPVAAALVARGFGLPATAGRPDGLFHHDGQITKSPIRAMTLAALAPRGGELLWDLGAGSGSVSVEWCLAGGRAIAVERRADRIANIRANAARFAVPLTVVQADLGELPDLPAPDAIFVGGGFTRALFDRLPNARLVVNAVTLETEALLAELHATHGGTLLRVDIARAEPLGRMHGWTPARPLTQWSVG